MIGPCCRGRTSRMGPDSTLSTTEREKLIDGIVGPLLVSLADHVRELLGDGHAEGDNLLFSSVFSAQLTLIRMMRIAAGERWKREDREHTYQQLTNALFIALFDDTVVASGEPISLSTFIRKEKVN